MHGRRDRQRLPRQIDVSENLARFGDARQTHGQNGGVDVVEVKVNMVAIFANAAPFAHFHRHGAGHDVAGWPNPSPMGRSVP